MNRQRKAAAAVALIGLAVAPSTAVAAMNDTRLASVPTAGSFALNDGNSRAIAASGNGRFVLFRSEATNMAGNDNDSVNGFVRDMVTGTTELVTVPTGTDGTTLDSGALPEAISADGRYVVFRSDATGVAPNQTPGTTGVFVRDRLNKTTEVVSLPSGGGTADGIAYDGSISADGRYVAFTSDADNLASNDNDAVYNIYVRDRLTKRTVLASLPTGHTGTANDALDARISADGRTVAYRTEGQIYVRDLESATTELVSKASTGDPAIGQVFGTPDISADGRFVAFDADADNLATNDNDSANVYRHDRRTGTTEVVSVGDGFDGTALTGDSAFPSLSSDGRHIAFLSDSPELVTNDNGEFNVYLRDMSTGETELASLATGTSGTTSDGEGVNPVISGDGHHVVFDSNATNFAAGDTNDENDVFVRTVLPTPPENVTRPALTGEPVVGQPLSCSDGLWTEGTVARVWRRNEQPIDGATAATYTLVADDAGDVIDCLVTATNADGSDSVDSNAVLPSTALQGPAGAAGSAAVGVPGPAGPEGAAGPAGPAGTHTTITRVLVGLITDSASARSGANVKFRYLTTGPAAATLEIRRGSRVLARVRQNASAAGRRTLTWNGRASGKGLAPGNYTTRITITDAGGAGTDADTGKLRITRRQRR